MTVEKNSLENFMNTFNLQSCAKDIVNLLGFIENLDLKEEFNVAFWLFQQDNYKIEFLASRLGTRLQSELFFSFHPTP